MRVFDADLAIKRIKEHLNETDVPYSYPGLIRSISEWILESPPDVPGINVGDLISRQALCEYALNQKDKSITPNDIMRFPSGQPEPCEDAVSRYSANYYSGRLKNDEHKAVEILDAFTKAFCIDAEAGNDLVFRCPECLFQMIDGTCLVKAFKHKFYPDYKDFGSMGDL